MCLQWIILWWLARSYSSSTSSITLLKRLLRSKDTKWNTSKVFGTFWILWWYWWVWFVSCSTYTVRSKWARFWKAFWGIRTNMRISKSLGIGNKYSTILLQLQFLLHGLRFVEIDLNTRNLSKSATETREQLHCTASYKRCWRPLLLISNSFVSSRVRYRHGISLSVLCNLKRITYLLFHLRYDFAYIRLILEVNFANEYWLVFNIGIVPSLVKILQAKWSRWSLPLQWSNLQLSPRDILHQNCDKKYRKYCFYPTRYLSVGLNLKPDIMLWDL